MGPCLFLPEHLFCLSHCKTRWTMSTNNAGLKTRILETYNSMVTLIYFFPWCKPKWSTRRGHRPISNLTRPWDDSLVNGANNPSISIAVFEYSHNLTKQKGLSMKKLPLHALQLWLVCKARLMTVMS